MHITRAQLLDLVERSGVPEPDRRRLLALPDPLDTRDLEPLLEQMGIPRDELVLRMGGSP